jgi:hypothetical protein
MIHQLIDVRYVFEHLNSGDEIEAAQLGNVFFGSTTGS